MPLESPRNPNLLANPEVGQIVQLDSHQYVRTEEPNSLQSLLSREGARSQTLCLQSLEC